ncbi:hypothetical protein [Mesobaculum littorinae]|nr:hypothetical protein [Mesobaculum littorinae]
MIHRPNASPTSASAPHPGRPAPQPVRLPEPTAPVALRDWAAI